MFSDFAEAVSQVIGIILGAAVITAILIVPIILTVMNLAALWGRDKKKKRHTAFTAVYGLLLSCMAVEAMSDFKWDEAVVYMYMDKIPQHQPFSEDYALSLFVFALLAVTALLMMNREKIMPPLAAALGVSGIYFGFILFTFCSVQLMKHPFINQLDMDIAFFVSPYLFLYALNYILCGIRVIRDAVIRYTDHFRENQTVPRSAFAGRLCEILSKVSGWIWFPLLCIIPLTGLLICICILFGQGPWGIIKAFTETSDWTFSRMISPPPVEYEGHYLCTVAVNGHEKLVKPTRLGIRRGVKIAVNRQLCAANAFEQLIEDKAPRFHRAVRYIYDRYGYPISKHITTKLRADIVYIVMKPLEWIFVLCLYLFDSDPESRIALQYTGKRCEDFVNDCIGNG